MGYRTEVHHTVLRSEYDRTVGNWGRQTLQMAKAKAIATAPARGGWKSENLRGRHESFFGFSGHGGYTLRLNLWNNASYALYVHEGTTGPIRPHGQRLVFPGSEIGNPRFMVSLRSVRGQSANPWLREAFQDAMWLRGVRGTMHEKAT